mmetsp:Transcript_2662/g.6886  ORF Transcript_2662/g.6886 Transcript_2662/m.6886 type:complete len:226 (-) Transcript_2662:993-1670(-)
MVSRVSEESKKLYSPRANALTSFLESMPSPSLSYFLKLVCMYDDLARAEARVAARSLKPLAVAMCSSDFRVHLFTRSKSCWVASPISVGVSPAGLGMSCISAPFVRINSVQAVTFALTSLAPLSMDLANEATSSTLRFSFFSSVSATDLRQSATDSASATSCSNSLTRARETSTAFCLLRSSSKCFSSFLRLDASICSSLFFACSKPFSASSWSFCTLVLKLQSS